MNTIRTTKKWKWILAACLIGALSLVALTGCGNSSKSSGSKGSESSESKITIAGSTSVQPLSEVLAEQYSKDHSDVKIDVQGGGSGQAAKSLEEGIAQIGALSREVESEEKKTIKNEYTIAMDGVAIVVNKNVGVDQLSIKQLRKIYTGDITTWKNVGGKDATIAVISREEGSGTRGAFTEITGVLEKDKKGNETDNTGKDAIIQ